MTWWRRNPRRLEVEKAMMKEKFPQFSLSEASSNNCIHGWTVSRKGQLYWLGLLTTVSGNRYTIVLTYPPVYPGQEIKSFVIEPYFPSLSTNQHRYSDGHLCLYSNDHGGKGQGTGPAMTAVSYVGWTAAWLHALEIYQAKGRWPENNFFDRHV
jgi:hypothetical protein